MYFLKIHTLKTLYGGASLDSISVNLILSAVTKSGLLALNLLLAIWLKAICLFIWSELPVLLLLIC